MTQDYQLDHLDELEAESMFVLREVAAQFERPAILFSGGKDSMMVTHLAGTSFADKVYAASPCRWCTSTPGTISRCALRRRRPSWNSVTRSRSGFGDRSVIAKRRPGQKSIDAGRVREETGAQVSSSRNRLQTTTLLDTIERRRRYNACIGWSTLALWR